MILDAYVETIVMVVTCNQIRMSFFISDLPHCRPPKRQRQAPAASIGKRCPPSRAPVLRKTDGYHRKKQSPAPQPHLRPIGVSSRLSFQPSA